MRIAIVGGGAAGATAAQFARKESRDAEIDIFEKSSYPQYSRCGLPYALSGEIKSFESLIEFSAEWFGRNKIDLHLSSEVVDIDHERKLMIVEDSKGRHEINYDSLILATGSSPSIPDIEGMFFHDKLRRGIFPFSYMDDAKSLREWCDRGSRRIVIIGSSLVAIECAEALHKLGNEVIIVKRRDQVLQRMIDPDMADPLVSAIEGVDIRLVTVSSVEKILGGDDVEGVIIRKREDDQSEDIRCDTLLPATGNRPMSSLASAIGCELGDRGHIKVDGRCETNLRGVFAIGDCSSYIDFVTRREMPAGTGTIAVKMGEIAGINATGGNVSLPLGFLNSRVTKLFGLEIAAIGPLTSELSREGLEFIQSRVKGSTVPVYYPGGKELLLKLTASREDGRLLSCQIVGESASALRANVIGAMIMADQKVQDLSELETVYAPPVAPTVDILTMAAKALLIKMRRSKASG